jgi:hypothetical protein
MIVVIVVYRSAVAPQTPGAISRITARPRA